MTTKKKDTNGKELTPSEWGKSLGIELAVTEEVKLFSSLGWAVDDNRDPRQLNIAEMKMLALACHQTGLSLMGKQLYFLGNSVYIAKSGKVYMAKKDKDMPLVRIETRPAKDLEREQAGLLGIGDPDEIEYDKFDHLWVAEVYAYLKEAKEVVKVSQAFGHARLSNIKLHRKEYDPYRLCKDMAETRAISRALSQVYNFMGYDSYEEVVLGQAAPEKREVIETTATVVEEGEFTAEAVLKLIEDNSDKLPDEVKEKFTLERLTHYAADGLKATYENIEAMLAVSEERRRSGQSGIYGRFVISL